MAKAAATLDALSSGRFELGLGAGANVDLAANFGGARRTTGESIDALEEAIDVIGDLPSRGPAQCGTDPR
jgi:alkanesulfonate monooxygenase SsuD/methylene tetrahydromethanopterin reductase-like flavin-dependent oxidoreductase (luciferase family)